jgi:hypothetical protein
MAEFTSAQKVGSLHAKVLAMADQFEAGLAEFIREGLQCVEDNVLMVGKHGEGVRLRVIAERATPEQVAEAQARQAGAG